MCRLGHYCAISCVFEFLGCETRRKQNGKFPATYCCVVCSIRQYFETLDLPNGLVVIPFVPSCSVSFRPKAIVCLACLLMKSDVLVTIVIPSMQRRTKKNEKKQLKRMNDSKTKHQFKWNLSKVLLLLSLFSCSIAYTNTHESRAHARRNQFVGGTAIRCCRGRGRRIGCWFKLCESFVWFGYRRVAVCDFALTALHKLQAKHT